MQLPDRAALGVARIGAANTGRVRRHLAHLLHDVVSRLTHGNGVAITFRHFLSVKARHAGGFR